MHACWVCSDYVLSSILGHLRDQGFSVEEVEITGELQEMVERGYVEWCVEVGVVAERREALLDTSRMGCGRTENPRKTRKDGLEELEKEVARKSIQKRFQKNEEANERTHMSGNACIDR